MLKKRDKGVGGGLDHVEKPVESRRQVPPFLVDAEKNEAPEILELGRRNAKVEATEVMTERRQSFLEAVVNDWAIHGSWWRKGTNVEPKDKT